MWLYLCESQWICSVICPIVICILQSFSDGAFFTSNPFELGDLFGTSVRSLAVFLLCWDSSGGAPANRHCSPLKHSCLWAVAKNTQNKESIYVDV